MDVTLWPVRVAGDAPPCGAARFSDDRKYRYLLGRRIGLGPSALWLMLNPSTADASVDDQTVRKVIAFCGLWGYGQAIIANLFALRATKPAMLLEASDPVGPENDDYLMAAFEELRRSGSGVVVCAWGSWCARQKRRQEIANRPFRVLAMLKSAGLVPHALRVTKHLAPAHPLYLPSSTTLRQWL